MKDLSQCNAAASVLYRHVITRIIAVWYGKPYAFTTWGWIQVEFRLNSVNPGWWSIFILLSHVDKGSNNISRALELIQSIHPLPAPRPILRAMYLYMRDQHRRCAVNIGASASKQTRRFGRRGDTLFTLCVNVSLDASLAGVLWRKEMVKQMCCRIGWFCWYYMALDIDWDVHIFSSAILKTRFCSRGLRPVCYYLAQVSWVELGLTSIKCQCWWL